MDHDCAATCIAGRFRLPFAACTRPSERAVCTHHYTAGGLMLWRTERRWAAQMYQLPQAYRITVVSTQVGASPT